MWKPNFLEKKVLDMEDKHSVQLQSMKEQKDQLQVLVSKQSSVIDELEKKLVTATVNNSVLQKQQHDLMETVNSLLTMMSSPDYKSSIAVPKEEKPTFRDCAEIFKSGLTTSGIYTLTFPNSTEEVKVRRDVPRQLWGLPVSLYGPRSPRASMPPALPRLPLRALTVLGTEHGC